VARFEALVSERARGVPVAYLLGRREFWGLDLQVSEATLIPRADTEILVECVLALPLASTGVQALDLGTGSGAIALALATERPGWTLTGTDISTAALAVARDNARALGLAGTRWLHGSWFEPVADERFDVIASNPPYLAEGDPHLTEGDLRFEPLGALVAAGQGLADLALIARSAGAHLRDAGWLVLEHGMDQGPDVRALLGSAGFHDVTSRRDLAGLERVTCGRWAGP
jgi:release factor glutamine methyltransferase